MESLDFVIDITENLEKQNIDYFLIALRKGKGGSKADVFYKMSDEQSVHNMCQVLEDLHEEIDMSNNKWPKNKETTKKKPATRKPNQKRRKPAAKKPKRPRNQKDSENKPKPRRGRPPKRDDSK